MEQKKTPTITAVTVTYMARWHFLSRLVDRVLGDAHVERLVIVSNASADIDKIRASRDAHPDRITLIELELNYGSAAAFPMALQEAGRGTSEYCLLLDDDNVPEPGFGDIFAQNLDLFIAKEERQKIVLLGNRHKLSHSQDIFTSLPFKNHDYVNSFFTVFSWKKVRNFLGILFATKGRSGGHNFPFLPITVSESFAYGGTLLPMEAVRHADFPDQRLFTYGDDIVYSWNVKNLGYRTYVCARPLIEDIDISLEGEYHFLAFFKESTHDFKVFFKIRNSAFLSMKYSKHPVVTFVSTYIWLIGLCLIAVCRLGFGAVVFRRMGLAFAAAWRGIKGNLELPSNIKMPDNAGLSPVLSTKKG